MKYNYNYKTYPSEMLRKLTDQHDYQQHRPKPQFWVATIILHTSYKSHEISRIRAFSFVSLHIVTITLNDIVHDSITLLYGPERKAV